LSRRARRAQERLDLGEVSEDELALNRRFSRRRFDRQVDLTGRRQGDIPEHWPTPDSSATMRMLAVQPLRT
jgi:hypothetical protein